jgi:hypothetical protein
LRNETARKVRVPASVTGGGAISSDTFDTGNAGEVNITAGTLSMSSSGNISSTAQSPASGNAGDVSVDVAGALTIDGTGATE